MILDVMRSRRSVRRFKPEAPDRAQVERLIEAAVTAPSASNKQPWRFLIVTDRAVIDRLAEAVRAAVDRVAGHIEPAFREGFREYGDYFTRFQAAPVVIVPLCRTLRTLSNMVDDRLPEDDRSRINAMEEDSGIIGASLAIQNLLLMAHDSGLGASCMTGPLIALRQVREILKVKPAWKALAFIPVGFGDEEPRPTPRKPVDKVMRWME